MGVSVVIATYNRLLPLAELLESLSKQTYKPTQVIIVNDGGSSVQAAVDAYPELPIELIQLHENVGHVEARNIGVRAVTEDFIMLCDDDDLLLPCHIERMIANMNDADFVYADVEIFHYRIENGMRIPTDRFLFAYECDLQAMRSFSTYVPSGSMYRRVIHDIIGYFDPYVHNYWDWDFFLRVAKQFRIKRVPIASVLYAFSNEGDHLSKQMNEKRQMYLNRLSEKHELGDLPTKNFWLLLSEPEVQKRKAKSEIIWNGEPFRSRLAHFVRC
ncbi:MULTISPECIES: glycosyltransferase family 2 protein [Anoxybacillus]|uniref:Glycosyltransferase involved in cell wall biosynthesis n=1 Tax=Anoxybacillus tengchongensis TaxID=576944 RepID=A0A7X0D989_9BACL|nr:glycosyltransferase family 2 protein [Anoxybacillus tengchongensis]MBB6176210.1 glycosyltransferase involved in cell wall biosynthesis [Anoxybacillus tengchongensis]